MSPAVLGGPPHTRASTVKGPLSKENGGVASGFEGLKASNRDFPHLEDLVNVRPEVDINGPIKHVLQAGETLARQADTLLDFRRPDMALQEYIKASIIAVELIPRHKEYPSLRDRGDLHRMYNGLMKRISAQDKKFVEVKTLIKENNSRTGVTPTAFRTLQENGAGNRRVGMKIGHGRTQSEQLPTSNGYANGVQSLSSESTPRKKPTIQPKPQALHGRVINLTKSPSQSDLATRFARLRSPEPQSSLQDPRIKTQVIPMSISDASTHTSQTTLQASNSLTTSRPSGPREMPPVPKPSTLHNKISVDVRVPDMPRAPDAIYSPLRGTDNPATASLPSSIKRSSSYVVNGRMDSARPVSTVGPTPAPVEPKQDYFVLAHSVNNHGGAQAPKSKPVFIPNSVYISTEDLQKFLLMGSSQIRIMLVDLRSRDQFDSGHIMSQSIICVEPVALRRGVSGEELADSMVVAPDAEQTLYGRRDEFDIIVFYDQSSTRVNPYNSSSNEIENSLHNFTAAVYDFGYEKKVKRRPMLLVGGLEAWTDMLGQNSLAVSARGNIASSTQNKASQRVLRPVGADASARPRIAHALRRKVESRILTREEQSRWDDTLRDEPMLGKPAGSDSTDSEEIYYARTTDDFFRRFPDMSTIEKESMTTTVASHGTLLSYNQDLASSIPEPPTRPAPALPRQRSSGISERGPTAVYSAGHSVNNGKAPNQNKVPYGITGLSNPSVLCYMNSCIQVISATRFLRNLLLKHRSLPFKEPIIPAKEGETSKPLQLMSKNVGVVLENIWSGNFDWITPKTLAAYVNAVNSGHPCTAAARRMNYGGSGQQHDASEFMRWMTNILADEWNPRRNARQLSEDEKDKLDAESLGLSAMASAQVFVHRLRQTDKSEISLRMGLHLVISSRCHACNYTARIHTGDLGLQLSIPQQETNIKKPVTLLDCIRMDWGPTRKETIPANCDECGARETRDGNEKTLGRHFSYFPDYLELDLIRYTFNPRTLGPDKDFTKVTFPERDIDLTEFFIDPAKPLESDQMVSGQTDHGIERGQRGPFLYDVYAVIHHQGSTANSGHYYCFTKSPDKSQGDGQKAGAWQKFNDSRVTPANFSETQTNNVASIFLIRQGAKGLTYVFTKQRECCSILNLPPRLETWLNSHGLRIELGVLVQQRRRKSVKISWCV